MPGRAVHMTLKDQECCDRTSIPGKEHKGIASCGKLSEGCRHGLDLHQCDGGCSEMTTNIQKRQFELQEIPLGSVGMKDEAHRFVTSTTAHISTSFIKPSSNGFSREYNVFPVSFYIPFLWIFEEKLRSKWPVLSVTALIGRLSADEDDYESHALAAATSAGVIAELRLPEHDGAVNNCSSHAFAENAQQFQALYDYRERCSIPSLLTSFFLHVYFNNTYKLRTAAFYLRQSLSQAHQLALHREETYEKLDSEDREHCYSIYDALIRLER